MSRPECVEAVIDGNKVVRIPAATLWSSILEQLRLLSAAGDEQAALLVDIILVCDREEDGDERLASIREAISRLV